MKKFFLFCAALLGMSSVFAQDLTYNVTVPVGTKACYIAGSMTSWSFTEMTKVDDTHYTITAGSGEYKYSSGPDWMYVEKDAQGEEIANRSYSENDVVASWAAVYDPETPTPPAPAGDAYYIKNCWDSGSWEWMEMTPNQDKSEWTYTGVYGGTGVNINTKADDSGAQWFPQDQIQGTATMGAEVTFTYNVAAGTVTAVSGDTPTPPTPKEEGFGIILGDGSTIKGQKNEAQIEFLEYMIEANLTIGTTFQLYDFANKASWTEDNIDEASTPNVIINGDHVYETVVDGKYTIYLKMYGPENNQVYIAYEASTGLREAIINAPAKKVMVDGTLYIVKDNKVYTAQGF